MTKPKTIRELKVGDTIFVVQQRRRCSGDERVSTEVITKVGRKYAYFDFHRREMRFLRNSGESEHGTKWNLSIRANADGFDVYLCEEDYRRRQFAIAEKERLRVTSMTGRFARTLKAKRSALAPENYNSRALRKTAPVAVGLYQTT